MHKTFKYRLRPTKKQERTLLSHIEKCRLIYNQLVCDRIQAWEKARKSLSLYGQVHTVSLIKQQRPEFTQVHSQVLQQVAVRVDLAFKAFSRRFKNQEGKVGFPRYKGNNRYDSITYPQFPISCRLDKKGLRLSKIGCVRITQHQPLIGTPKTCVITKTATGKWFASISCVTNKPSVDQQNNFPDVGIDLGIEKFATLSNGEEIPNPRFFQQEEKTLLKTKNNWRKNQKKLKTNPSREKKRRVVARVHERIRNKRHNFAHQTARSIVNRFSLIAHEDLNINRMLHNKCLSKSISDVAWSMFLRLIAYKAEEAGRKVVPVNPAYTSQDCSKCGHRQKKTLANRRHTCTCCGVDIDRDYNAALNILRLGRQSQVNKSPRSPST